MAALFESSIKSLPRLGKGKVRDIYGVGNDKMLIVASDRLSAFDVVLPDPAQRDLIDPVDEEVTPTGADAQSNPLARHLPNATPVDANEA